MAILSVVCIIIAVAMFVKYLVAFNYHTMIIEAIHDYQVWCFQNRKEYDVDYSDIESMKNTWLRVWDWGYHGILPAKKMIIIKPYIKK